MKKKAVDTQQRQALQHAQWEDKMAKNKSIWDREGDEPPARPTQSSAAAAFSRERAQAPPAAASRVKEEPPAAGGWMTSEQKVAARRPVQEAPPGVAAAEVPSPSRKGPRAPLPPKDVAHLGDKRDEDTMWRSIQAWESKAIEHECLPEGVKIGPNLRWCITPWCSRCNSHAAWVSKDEKNLSLIHI